MNKDWINRHKRILLLMMPLVALFAFELLLSLTQILKYRQELKPYYVSPILRPIIRYITKDDFYPRTHRSVEIYWDNKTNRMRPGTYEQGDGRPSYTVNSYGIRGPEFSIPKPSGIYRIVVFGGSATFGGESPDDKTFPVVLEKILNSKVRDKKIEVLNYGIGSKSLYYIARKYFSEVETLQPDMIIINSIRNTWFYDQNQEVCNYEDITLPESYLRNELDHFLTDNFLTYRLWRKNHQKQVNIGYFNNNQVKYNRAFFDSLYYKVIRSIYHDAKRRGIKMAMAIEPFNFNPEKQLYYKPKSNDELYAVMDQSLDDSDIICSSLLYNNIYRLQKEADKLIVIDPIEYFLKLEAQNPQISLMVDHFHLTEQGNEVFADFIADRLIDKL